MRYWACIFIITTLFSCGNDSSNSASGGENTSFVSSPEIIQKGKKLFNSNCKVCHSINVDLPSGMAPVLLDITTKWPDKQLLASYIKNAPAEMKKTSRGQEIYKKWKNKAQMPPFEGLNQPEINSIIAFLYSL